MKNVLIVFCLFASTLLAQVDWFGYYEAEADYAALPNNDIFFHYNKLRLDVSASPSKHVSIGADVVAKIFQGETQLNLMDYLHQSYHPVFPDGSTLDYFPYALSDTLFLDNAFMKIYTKYVDITLGRQQISPGVGYVWNPVDVFNVKDITDPTYEQTGVDAIRLDVPLGPFSLTSAWQLNNKAAETTQYYELKTQIGRFDVAGVYAHAPLHLYNFSFAEQSSIRDIYGLYAEGEIWAGIGVRAEIASHHFSGKQKLSYIIGADYTFENSLYILAEYFHNKLGANHTETNFLSYLNYLAGLQKSLNQNYVYAMGLYPLGDLLDGGCAMLANIDDNSLMFIPQAVYRAFTNVEITGMLQISAGQSKSEFGAQGFGGLVRVRAYF